MTIKEAKNILDECLIYNYKIESLKNELKNINDDLKPRIQNEINKLSEKVMDVRCKIDSLENPNVKLVMRFRFINGMSFKEISEKLGMTYQWINKLYNNGLEELKNIL